MIFRKDPVKALETELRTQRPQPSESLVNALHTRVAEDGRQSRLRVYARLSFACAISVLMLGILASFGGIGYAASSTVEVAKVAKRVVTPATPKPAPVVAASPSHDQYKPEKVTICHRTGSGHGVTITISRSALPAHLAHGDTIGPCAGNEN